MIFKLLQRFLNRIAYFAPGGYKFRPQLHRLRGVHIGKNVWISQYVYIDELHPSAVTIGDNCSIGLRTSIITHFYWGPLRSDEHAVKVHIEENVFIGPHCVILPGVHIGKGAVIQAGTVVTRDVPSETVWGTPKSEPIARATIPLTPDFSYEEFVKGIRPLRK
jgi:acetyltransferase-like isoleucine patch superfamily enzyme